VVEDPRRQDQPPDEVRPSQRREQRDRRAVAVPDQVGRAADDLLEEGHGVPGHEVVADGTGDVGGAPVAAPVGSEHPEPLGQPRQVDLEGAGVGVAGVQEDQRGPVAVLLVVGAHGTELDVLGHGVLLGSSALSQSRRRSRPVLIDRCLVERAGRARRPRQHFSGRAVDLAGGCVSEQ
jgi:hypothetical protein